MKITIYGIVVHKRFGDTFIFDYVRLFTSEKECLIAYEKLESTNDIMYDTFESDLNVDARAWLARDKSKALYLHTEYPVKCNEDWNSSDMYYWTEVGNNKFPNIKWKDKEPTEVNIIIKKK